MDTNTLDSVIKLRGFVKLIDQQIEGITAIATQLISTDNLVYVNFSTEDLNQFPGAVMFDESDNAPPPNMGFLIPPGLSWGGSISDAARYAQMPRHPQRLMHIHKFRLSTTIALNAMACINQGLIAERDNYYSQIQELLNEKTNH